ncbi:MAG: UDP-N-acetylmuramate--L-alanine ligase [Deltaproteobacteria bacterium]|nr:UDP-N-acetylmuramate--L-alanine ligase [Deltaproteobacteria bacterium]
MFKKYQHIHFVGIGGIGMSGIAEVLLNLGYKVSGSDLKKTPLTSRLQKRGARIFLGHAKDHVDSAEVVVVSSAVQEENPEVRQARQKNIPVVPRAEMLAELMRMKYGIAVSGTHGKTTTTSMIGTILFEAGLDPTLIIGGRLNSLRSNARLGKGEFLVAEADESDQSFLKLNPTIAVITNIDPEHMENYKSFASVKQCYIAFANKVPFYGAVVACVDHPQVRQILPSLCRRVVTYGIKSPAEYTAKNITQQKTVMSFDVFYHGDLLGRAKLCQPGAHHVGNALAAIAVARELDIPFSKIVVGLKKFKGISRRFEILRKEDPMVADDYAHHPVEIEATIQAARQGWPGYKIAVVLQPHRFSRLKLLWNDFVKTLAKPDLTVVLPVYAAGEKPMANITGKNLFMELREKNPKSQVTHAESLEEIRAALTPWVGPKTMILFLGAGDVTKMAREFCKNLC